RPIIRRQRYHWYLEKRVVRPDPRGNQGIQVGLPSRTRDEIRVIVENGPVADHDLIGGLRFELLSDLGVKNPRLRRRCSLLVDRERASPRDFFHQLDAEVESLQLRREVEAQRCLSHAVRSDERNLETSSSERIEREKRACVTHLWQ